MIHPNAITHTEFNDENKYNFFLPIKVFSKRIEQVPIIVRGANFIIDNINKKSLQIEFADMDACKFWKEISTQIIAATGAGKTMIISAIMYLVTKYIKDNNIDVPSRAVLFATPWIALNSQTESEIIKNIQQINPNYSDKKYLKIFIEDSANGRESNFSNIFHASSFSNGYTTVQDFVSDTPRDEFAFVVCCNKSLHKVNNINFLFAVADEAHRIANGVETNKLWFQNVRAGTYLYLTATRTVTASPEYSMENMDKYGKVIGVINYETCFKNNWILEPAFHAAKATEIIYDDGQFLFDQNVRKRHTALLCELKYMVGEHEKHVRSNGGRKHKLLVSVNIVASCIDAIENWYNYSFGGKYLICVAFSNTDAYKKHPVLKDAGQTVFAINGVIYKSREEWMRIIKICKHCIVCNYDIFKEGIDIKSLTAGVLCRNLVDNKISMVQLPGRIFRNDTGENETITPLDVSILGNNIDIAPDDKKKPQILYISENGNNFLDEHYLEVEIFRNENYGYHGIESFVEGGGEGLNKETKELQIIIGNRFWLQNQGIDTHATETANIKVKRKFGQR